MEGQKFSEGKLPIYQVLMVQFRHALQEVAKSSQAGNVKYSEGDLDWLNFTRVPNGQFQFLNAAMRHLMEAEDRTYNEDMKEYGQIRHRAQAIWNLLCSLELELRQEEQNRLVGINKSRLQASIEQSKSVNPQKSQTNLDEWMAKHKVENELKDIDLSFRSDPPPGTLNMSLCLEDTPENKTWLEELEKIIKENMMKPPPFPDFSKEEQELLDRQQEIIQGTVEMGETPYIFAPTPGWKWSISKDCIYHSRPTLTVDQLLNRDDNDKGEEYYPDQEIN